MGLAVAMPAIILLIMLAFYCRRRLRQSRQFAPRRTSFGPVDSMFYPEDNIPSTPSEKSKSVTFDFTGSAGTVTPPNSPSSGGLFGKARGSKTSEDKLDLVDNDQLEQMHKFP